jgi:hypothetical protein
MKSTCFTKTLSPNDVGATGTHQAGILVPKTEKELLAFLPKLDANVKNPDAWIHCIDEDGVVRKFRFVYYNNSLHDENGTRNEYRLTYMTKYLKAMAARANDLIEISRDHDADKYKIRIVRLPSAQAQASGSPIRIKITTGWRRIH